MNSPDFVRLRLAIQVGLVCNVPPSVRIICVELVADQIRLAAIFERQPTEDEKEMILDAALDAAGDFEREIQTTVKYLVDTRAMEVVIPDIRDRLGFMVYARYEEGF